MLADQKHRRLGRNGTLTSGEHLDVNKQRMKYRTVGKNKTEKLRMRNGRVWK